MRFRTQIIIVALVSIALLLGTTVLALTTLSFNQNPSVPSTGTSFSTTPAITQSSDQTALWTYNAGSGSFQAQITFTNTGNTLWTPVITATSVVNWAFSTSALTPIAAGQSLQVTLTMTYTPQGVPPAGPMGAFTVTVA